MTRENREFRNFYVPAVHIDSAGERAVIPPKATDEEEIALRQSLGKYSARFLDQRLGLAMAQQLAHIKFQDRLAQDYTYARLGSMLYNTAFHNFQLSYELSGDDVMNKVVGLPRLATDGENPFRETPEGILALAHHDLGAAAIHASTLVSALEITPKDRREKRIAVYSRHAGRTMGEAALKLAVVNLAHDYGGRSATEIQSDVRQVSLSLVEQSRSAYESGGKDPTLIYLARGAIDDVFRGAPDEAISALAGVRQQYDE